MVGTWERRITRIGDVGRRAAEHWEGAAGVGSERAREKGLSVQGVTGGISWARWRYGMDERDVVCVG